jgi:hypothetical protein
MDNNYDRVKCFKAKTIDEIAWLRFKEIPVIREIQYERKRVFFFLDDKLQASDAIKEYYNSDYYKFAQQIQEVRMDIFMKMPSEVTKEV